MLDYPISNNKEEEEEGNFIRIVLHNNLYQDNVINTVNRICVITPKHV